MRRHFTKLTGEPSRALTGVRIHAVLKPLPLDCPPYLANSLILTVVLHAIVDVFSAIGAFETGLTDTFVAIVFDWDALRSIFARVHLLRAK